MDLYVHATPWYNDVFDANGDDVTDDTWHKFSTLSPAPDTDPVYSGNLGNIADGSCPNRCPEPTYGNYRGRGWDAWNRTTVIRWDVTNGFEYVSAA